MQGISPRIEALIPYLRRYARALVNDAEGADDLVQACLEGALETPWHPSQELRIWLFQIQHKLFIASRHRHGPMHDHQGRNGLKGDAAAGSGETNAPVERMQDALAELAPQEKSVLLLVALEGLSYQEVAEVTAVPVGVVRAQLSRAREALRACPEFASSIGEA